MSSTQQQQQQQQGSPRGGGGGAGTTGNGGGGGGGGAGNSGGHFGGGGGADTSQTKVFVGGLAWETTREGVRRHFEQFGEISEAVVITDKSTGRSKGYGFVTFRDKEGASRACLDPMPVIDGRRANCNLASINVRSRPGTAQHGRYRGPNPSRSPARTQAMYNVRSPASSPHHVPYPYQQQAYQYGPPYGYSYQQEYLYPHPNMMYNGHFFVGPPFPQPSVYPGGASGGRGPPPPPAMQGSPASLYQYPSPLPLSANSAPATTFQPITSLGPSPTPSQSQQQSQEKSTAGTATRTGRGPHSGMPRQQDEEEEPSCEGAGSP